MDSQIYIIIHLLKGSKQKSHMSYKNVMIKARALGGLEFKASKNPMGP